jgi:hypothetical protein
VYGTHRNLTISLHCSARLTTVQLVCSHEWQLYAKCYSTTVQCKKRKNYGHNTVVGENLFIWGPLEVKCKGIRGAADKEEFSVDTINIISQWQYFVARWLSSCVDNVFGLHSMCFSFYPQASDVGEAHSLVPGTVLGVWASVTGGS